MNELLSIFQSFVNYAFIATLLLITINNINRKIGIKTPIQIIRNIIIVFWVFNLINLTYYLFFEKESEENLFFFLNRASGPMKFTYLFMIFSSLISPIILFIKRCRENKWVILIVSFSIIVGAWFERFVILVTSLYRGHMPASWA